MAQSKNVVIVGGHGKIALLTASRLVSVGCTVKSLIRNPEQRADVSATGAIPAVLDIENTGVGGLADAFAGADAVVFSAGAGGGNPARTHAVDFVAATRAMEAAQKAGVARFVIVSYAGAGVDVDRLDESDPFAPYARAKHDADARLRDTDLDYTILGPGHLTLEPASGKIRLADESGEVIGRELSADERVTSRENVAEVIVHVLVHDAGIRRTVNFFDGDTPIEQAIR